MTEYDEYEDDFEGVELEDDYEGDDDRVAEIKEEITGVGTRSRRRAHRPGGPSHRATSPRVRPAPEEAYGHTGPGRFEADFVAMTGAVEHEQGR